MMMGNKKKLIRKIFDYKIFILDLVLFVFAAFLVPMFASATNISQLMVQMSINGIVALGMTVIMIPWGIDLGVGSTLALAGVIYALGSNAFGVPVGVLMGVLAGTLVGLWNGILVNRVNINFFIATLASMTIFRGLALTLSGNDTIYTNKPGFDYIGSAYFNINGFKLGLPFLIFLSLAVIIHIALKYTQLGRNWYAIGSNSEASYLSGINVKNVFTLAFVVVGMCSGISGVLLASRTSSASPIVGVDTSLVAIASTVLGGTSLYGGTGSIPGAVAGLIFINILENIMSLKAVSPYYQYIIRGSVLIIVVLIDVFYAGKKKSKSHIIRPKDVEQKEVSANT